MHSTNEPDNCPAFLLKRLVSVIVSEPGVPYPVGPGRLTQLGPRRGDVGCVDSTWGNPWQREEIEGRETVHS